jgi:hypothetical protein
MAPIPLRNMPVRFCRKRFRNLCPRQSRAIRRSDGHGRSCRSRRVESFSGGYGKASAFPMACSGAGVKAKGLRDTRLRLFAWRAAMHGNILRAATASAWPRPIMSTGRYSKPRCWTKLTLSGVCAATIAGAAMKLAPPAIVAIACRRLTSRSPVFVGSPDLPIRPRFLSLAQPLCRRPDP